MYLRRVVLENIKSLESADLELYVDKVPAAGWSVITGDNGSGKTALLRSIAMALLGPDQIRSLLPDLVGWVTQGKSEGTISVEVEPNHNYDRTQRGGYPSKTFWAEISIVDQDGYWEASPTDRFRRKKKGAANGPWVPSTDGWAALGYGPFRRLYGSSPDAQRLMVIRGRVPRFATLFKEDATLGEGEEWLKELKYRSTYETTTNARATLDQLFTLLADEFLRNGVTIADVNADGVWLRDSQGRDMPLADMSEGYRAAIAMLIDIFRHFVEIYGAHGLVKNEPRTDVVTNDTTFEAAHSYVDRPGVVLIDEIDAHLHPEWQRVIGFWLKRRFPQVQFIVTTHSPLVCQAADAGRIYHMPQPGEGRPFRLSPEDYEAVIAGKPDEILLTPAFGLSNTRSPRAVRARKRHSLLVAKQLSARGLSRDEEAELGQLSMFANG